MRAARDSLRGGWGVASLFAFLAFLASLCINNIPRVGVPLGFLLDGYGYLVSCAFFLSFSRGKKTPLSSVFDGLGGWEGFWNSVGTYILSSLFIILWALLLLIPGVVASYSYAMKFYILADSPQTSPLRAITKSRDMMMGNRWRLFCMHARFSGWIIPCLLTAGLGFFWFIPYVRTATARFYDDLKDRAESLD